MQEQSLLELKQDSQVSLAERLGNDYYSEAQVAEFLGITVATLRNRRVEGTSPRFFKDGRQVWFHIDDIKDYIETRRIANSYN